MWFKMGNDTYFDTDHSTILGATGSADAGYYVECVTPHTGGNPRKLREGFESKAHAQTALDNFMDGLGFEEIPSPDETDVPEPESDVDDEDLDDDDVDVQDNYDNMTVPELRTTLHARNLDTQGNKPDLVARLRADDTKRAEEEEV